MTHPSIELLPRGFIGFKKTELSCSFCKRLRSEVPRLFANGLTGEERVTICTDCLAEATAVAKETS